MTQTERLIDTIVRLGYPPSSYVVDQTNDVLTLRWQSGSGPTIEELLSDETQASLPPRVIAWPCREFLQRFTADERQAIIVAGRSNAAVEDLRSILLASPTIHSDSPELVAGMSALVSARLITAGRRDQILGLA